jgi:hypothetical protein
MNRSRALHRWFQAILARFTRTAAHPDYQAMLEIGRAQRTVFVARYLRDRDLQREIEEGLNPIRSSAWPPRWPTRPGTRPPAWQQRRDL